MSGGHFIVAACMLAGALVAPFIQRALSHVAFPQYEQEVRLATGGGDPYQGRDRIRQYQYGCDTCHRIPAIGTADATVGPITRRDSRDIVADLYTLR